MPHLYNQIKMLPISPTAFFPLVSEDCLSIILWLNLPLSLSALNQSSHVLPAPFFSPILSSFPEGDLDIRSTHQAWPDLYSGDGGLICSFLGDPGFQTHQPNTPGPRSISHIPVVFSTQLPLMCLHFFRSKEWIFLQDPSGGAERAA